MLFPDCKKVSNSSDTCVMGWLVAFLSNLLASVSFTHPLISCLPSHFLNDIVLKWTLSSCFGSACSIHVEKSGNIKSFENLFIHESMYTISYYCCLGISGISYSRYIIYVMSYLKTSWMFERMPKSCKYLKQDAEKHLSIYSLIFVWYGDIWHEMEHPFFLHSFRIKCDSRNNEVKACFVYIVCIDLTSWCWNLLFQSMLGVLCIHNPKLVWGMCATFSEILWLRKFSGRKWGIPFRNIFFYNSFFTLGYRILPKSSCTRNMQGFCFPSWSMWDWHAFRFVSSNDTQLVVRAYLSPHCNACFF